ncbi:MAG: V-type ATP synthase subunit E [Anaerolineae bacterium]|nr:V-type ATP synthase subunit E [Anaerolineae bacterium]
MSLEAILAAIHAAGERQVEEIERRAAEEAEAILAAARKEAEAVRQDACARAVAPAYREHARIIHRARLLNLRTVGAASEVAIDTALEHVQRCLAALRSEGDYAAILRRLTEEALDGLRGSLEDVSRAQIEVDARDVELMAGILSDLGLDLEVRGGLRCWGGLVAYSEDACIVVINTLESRLERAMPFLRRDLAALFEKGDGVRPASIMETPAYAR